MSGVVGHDHPIDTIIAVSEVLTNPRLARVYAQAFTQGPAAVDDLASGLSGSKTTVYEDVNYLTAVGLLERVTDKQPHRYRGRPIDFTVESNEQTYHVTTALLVALARTETNENLKLYLDRHGRSGLATALEYAPQYTRGRANARVMARDLSIPVLEAEIILQELREVLLEVEPELAEDLDLEALDRAVNDFTPE